MDCAKEENTSTVEWKKMAGTESRAPTIYWRAVAMTRFQSSIREGLGSGMPTVLVFVLFKHLRLLNMP
jgi:hypothetical protein